MTFERKNINTFPVILNFSNSKLVTLYLEKNIFFFFPTILLLTLLNWKAKVLRLRTIYRYPWNGMFMLQKFLWSHLSQNCPLLFGTNPFVVCYNHLGRRSKLLLEEPKNLTEMDFWNHILPKWWNISWSWNIGQMKNVCPHTDGSPETI